MDSQHPHHQNCAQATTHRGCVPSSSTSSVSVASRTERPRAQAQWFRATTFSLVRGRSCLRVSIGSLAQRRTGSLSASSASRAGAVDSPQHHHQSRAQTQLLRSSIISVVPCAQAQRFGIIFISIAHRCCGFAPLASVFARRHSSFAPASAARHLRCSRRRQAA